MRIPLYFTCFHPPMHYYPLTITKYFVWCCSHTWAEYLPSRYVKKTIGTFLFIGFPQKNYSFSVIEAQILGFCVTCGVKMMSLRRGWGWQPPQTAPQSILDISEVFEQIDIDMLPIGIKKQPFTVIRWLRFWGSGSLICGVDMMWLCHGWGWQPLQTASPIHLRHFRSVWAHWYAVHWHTAASFHSYLAQILGFWVTPHVESIWCDYVMVEADSHLKLFLPSILDIYKVFEHIDMLSISIQ